MIPECGIAEFDQLLGDVEDMKQQIRELIQRSREQEKEAQQMGIRKAGLPDQSAFSAECVEFDPVDGTDESSEGYRRIHKCTEKAVVV